MNINQFHEFSSAKICPVCRDNNLRRIILNSGIAIYECINCGGIPSYCQGTIFISKGCSTDHYSRGNCSYCGQRSASANDHAYLSKW